MLDLIKSRALFQQALHVWYRVHQRKLPWRDAPSLYKTVVSELMLQQTQVTTVLPYFDRWLRELPDFAALAAAPEAKVMKLWEGLGYYSRARNLHKLAQAYIAAPTKPRTPAEWRELPGIGPYTAAAITSISFDEPAAVVDGNVVRILARLTGEGRLFRDGNEAVKHFTPLADTLVVGSNPGEHNQAMMELGATLCTPQSPQCLLCPVAQFCQARKLGLADSIPARRKKRATENVILAAAVFLDPRGNTLLLPPPKLEHSIATGGQVPSLVSKLWHFPTIAVETNPATELLAHLKQILPQSMTKHPLRLEPLPPQRHTVTHRAISLRPFRISVTHLPRVSGAKTIPLSDVPSPSSLAISNLTRKAARAAFAAPAALSARA